MNFPESFPFPNRNLPLPLDCIALGQATLGAVCEGCPLAPDNCRPLAAGREIVALQTTNSVLQQENENLAYKVATQRRENEELLAQNTLLIERLFALRIDTLVEHAYTPEGLRDYLQNESELAKEMRALNWGVIRLDARFVNYINRFGHGIGDDFLRQGGSHIAAAADGLGRYREEPREVERRDGHTASNDILCRQGGDEFSLIIRNVTPEQLLLVATRLQQKLTPAQALERYAQGQVPFIASVGFAHATQPRTEVITHLDADSPWQAFDSVNRTADNDEKRVKLQQYREMIELVRHIQDPKDQAPIISINEDQYRKIAEEFLHWLCPDFWHNPADFIEKSRS